MSVSLFTMVIHLYPAIKTNLQFISALSPSRWFWYKKPENFVENKIFNKTLNRHKESWWNSLLAACFKSFKCDESDSKRSK